jgi:alanyl-tRNA synthetase
MERQRAEARKHWKGSGSAAIAPIWFDLRERTGATEFLGYETPTAEGKVVGLVVDDALVEQAGPGTEVRLIANQTPFYGESGGQIGDTGTITSGDATVKVTDTQKYLGDLFVHIGVVERGTIKLGDDIRLDIDVERRARIRRAHSATHLMHKALQRHLGAHVAQKGSRVEPDRLRFDFSHPKPVSKEEIAAVEREVNHYLRQNDPTTIRIMAKDDAIETGAMALFGEKYGDEVRVVSMGKADDGKTYSVELCGGTHVGRTGDIALFKLLSEGAVAAGVRRIEAVTGQLALEHVEEEEAILSKAAGTLKVPPAELPGRIEALVEERRKLERELADLRRKIATGGLASENAARQINGISFAARQLEGVPAKELRGTADELKKQMGSGVVALVSVTDGKASVVVSTTEDLTGRIDSVALVRRAVEALGGQGGGGRRDFAQGGGPDAAKAAEALSVVEATLATL